MTSNSQLTRRSALGVGVLCIAVGAPTVLGALGLIPIRPSPGVPIWVVGAAGLTFWLVAIVMFADAIAGGTNSDGTLPAGTPPAVHLLQAGAALAVVLALAAITTWIAFGPGERHFSITIALPFLIYHPKHSDLPGRIVFGAGAVMIWIIAIAGTVAAMKRHFARRTAVRLFVRTKGLRF